MRDNLIAHQGVPFAYGWPVTDEEGNPLDLTGWRIRSQIRSAPGQPILHEFDGPGRADGLAVIAASGEDTVNWTFGIAQYDVLAIPADPDGSIGYVGGGSIRVMPRVTQT